MGTAEEESRAALVKGLLNGSQHDRDRFIITTLLDMKVNGCARACDPSRPAIWTPAAIATAAGGTIIAVIEYFRK